MEKIVVLGSVPPPWEGMAVANKNVLESKLIRTRFVLLHYDTKINIKLSTIGKISIVKLFNEVCLCLNYPFYLVRNKPSMLYMPLSGSRKGILRDIPFILIAKIFGLKVVLHYHASFYDRLFEGGFFFFKKIVRLALVHVNRHIVVCEKLRGMLSSLNIPKDRVSVVENGLQDDSQISGVATDEKGVFKILYLGNLMPAKGYFDVLESIPYLLKKLGDTKSNRRTLFVFVGAFKSRADRVKFDNFVNVYRISNYVKTLGVLTGQDKSKVLMESNVFVFPSYSEGQPFVLIEALRSGLPVIITKVGCMGGMIKKGINGYFVPIKSPDAIADKIFLLMNAPDLARQMGENNRRVFEKKYTYTIFEANMIKTFQEVLGYS